jgi:hypothetical protein
MSRHYVPWAALVHLALQGLVLVDADHRCVPCALVACHVLVLYHCCANGLRQVGRFSCGVSLGQRCAWRVTVSVLSLRGA